MPLLLLALWLLLLPVLLWARYRNGRARRRAHGWVIRVNAWLLAASVPMLAIAGVFLGYALAYTWGLRARLPQQRAAA
jgi:uncharacterized membrane protein